MKALFEDPAVEKVGHDLKADPLVLGAPRHRGGGPGFDTMLASYLIDSTRAPHALEDAGARRTSATRRSPRRTSAAGRQGDPWRRFPATAVLAYAGERADLAASARRPA